MTAPGIRRNAGHHAASTALAVVLSGCLIAGRPINDVVDGRMSVPTLATLHYADADASQEDIVKRLPTVLASLALVPALWALPASAADVPRVGGTGGASALMAHLGKLFTQQSGNAIDAE